MKILHVGNMGNGPYAIVKALRKFGIDAELLMPRYPPDITSDPKGLDPELTVQGYPGWIKFWDNSQQTTKRHTIGWKYDIVKQMRDRRYDLIHAYTELPIFAYLSRRLFVAQAQGSDLWELAFQRSLKGFLLRRAYHKAKVLIYFGVDHGLYTSKLNIKNAIFMKPYWDVRNFVPKEIPKNELANKFVIFHPTGQTWAQKANYKFLKAFIRLCKERDDIFLITIDRGPDNEKLKELLNQPYVMNKVKILPQTLKQSELTFYYNLADAVADQFHWGAIGQIGYEAMACAKPVIAFIYADLYQKLWGETPPVVNANDEDSIYGAILKLLNSRTECKDLGLRSRMWVMKHMNEESFARRYLRLYQGVLNGEDFEEIRSATSKIM